MCSLAWAIAAFHPPRYPWVDLTDVRGLLMKHTSRQSIIHSGSKVVQVWGDPPVLKHCPSLHFRSWGFAQGLLSPVLRPLGFLFCCMELSTCVCLCAVYLCVCVILATKPIALWGLNNSWRRKKSFIKNAFFPTTLSRLYIFCGPASSAHVKVSFVFFFHRSWQVWNYNGKCFIPLHLPSFIHTTLSHTQTS